MVQLGNQRNYGWRCCRSSFLFPCVPWFSMTWRCGQELLSVQLTQPLIRRVAVPRSGQTDLAVQSRSYLPEVLGEISAPFRFSESKA